MVLSACASTEQPTTQQEENVIVNQQTKKEVAYPSDNDLSPCGAFSVVNKGDSMRDIYQDRVPDSKTLKICSTKQATLSQWIQLQMQQDKSDNNQK